MGLRRSASKMVRRAVMDYRKLCWKVNKRFRKYVTVSTRQGRFTVFLGAEDAVGRSLYCSREYELDLMRSCTAFLREQGRLPAAGQGTILDVGANNGVICVGMLHTGQFERAIAIEPEPRNFALLERNVAQNGLEEKVIARASAVSDRQGEVTFELSEINFGDHRVRTDRPIDELPGRYGESERRVISVPCDTLDNLVAGLPESFSDGVALIWVDVQGFEGHVFRGAGQLLAKGVPVVAELWPYGLKRAGTSREEFCRIAEGIWPAYWVLRRGKFVRYPIGVLDTFFDELGDEGDYDNVIFM